MHTPVLALYEMGIKQVAVPQAEMLEWPADLVKDAKLLNVSMNSNFDIEFSYCFGTRSGDSRLSV